MMTDQSETAKMLSDAKHEFHGFEDKKAKVTRNVGLCLTSLEACKREVQSTSFLSRQSAQDTMARYNQTKISVNELEESVSKYLELFSYTYQDNIATNETDEENQDKLQEIIDQNLAILDEYCTKFDNI